MTGRVGELLAIMARLRAADGCPWDREQTYASIAPYTIEEAYEVVDAIERGDLGGLRDELGDLLLQVVFHAQMASEQGRFDFEAVAASICDKLVRRHPHVFGDSGPISLGEQTVVWERIKAQERREDPARRDALSRMDGIARNLPALLRTQKLSKRAARAGFDFTDAAGTADKVAEELAEARAAVLEADIGGAGSEHVLEEIGDLLFAAANLARKLGVDAEAALRAANLKFERRFRAMEKLADARGETFEDLAPAAQERLWQEVKSRE